MVNSSRCLIAVPVKTAHWVIVLPSQNLPSDTFYEREAERIIKKHGLLGLVTQKLCDKSMKLRVTQIDNKGWGLSVSLLSFLKQGTIADHIQHGAHATRGTEGVPGEVGTVPRPVLPGACHSFLCEAEAVATWTAGCELRSPASAQTTTSFYTVNTLVHNTPRSADPFTLSKSLPKKFVWRPCNWP